MTDMDESAVEAVARAIQDEMFPGMGTSDIARRGARAAIAAMPTAERVAKLEVALRKIASMNGGGTSDRNTRMKSIARQALASGESE